MALGDVLKQVSGLRAEVWAKENIEASLFLEQAPPVFAHEQQLQLLVLYLPKSAERSLGVRDMDSRRSANLDGYHQV